MAIFPASLTPIPQPAAVNASTTGSSTGARPATGGLFQAVLASASNQQPTTATSESVNLGTNEANTEVAEDALADAAEVAAGGIVALAAQFLNPPVNAAVAQANGTAPPVETADTARTRADDLLFDRAGGPTQVATQTTPTPADPTAADTAPLGAAAAATAATTNELPVPPALPPNDAANVAPAMRFAHRVAIRGGLPNIPPPAPIVADLLPPARIPADLSAAEPVVNAPTPIVPASGLPAAELGSRPAMAGERFAADAAAGAQLASPTAPPSGIFANVFDEEAAVATLPPPQSAAAATPIPPQSPAAINPAVAAPVVPPETAVVRPASQANVLNEAAIPPTSASASPLAVPPPVEVVRTTEFDNTRIAREDTITNSLAFAPPLAEQLRVSTAPVAPTVTATPAAQVAEAVVTQARILERPGEVEFQLRLDPPELGRVQIRLVSSGDEMRGQVLVADDTVRRLLESQLPELRQRLEAAGVTVQGFDIATDTDTGTGGSRNPYRDVLPEYTPPFATAEASPAPPRARIGRAEPGTLDVTV